MAGAVCKYASIPSFTCTPSFVSPETLSFVSPSSLPRASRRRGSRKTQRECRSRALGGAQGEEQAEISGEGATIQNLLSRRHALAALSAAVVGATWQDRAEAVQGMVAGRLPGLGPEAADGRRRPLKYFVEIPLLNVDVLFQPAVLRSFVSVRLARNAEADHFQTCQLGGMT